MLISCHTMILIVNDHDVDGWNAYWLWHHEINGDWLRICIKWLCYCWMDVLYIRIMYHFVGAFVPYHIVGASVPYRFVGAFVPYRIAGASVPYRIVSVTRACRFGWVTLLFVRASIPTVLRKCACISHYFISLYAIYLYARKNCGNAFWPCIYSLSLYDSPLILFSFSDIVRIGSTSIPIA